VGGAGGHGVLWVRGCVWEGVGGLSCDSGGGFARAMDRRLEVDFAQYSRALMFVNVPCNEVGG
jgi:hypothetical protein